MVLLHIFCCPKALSLDMLCPKESQSAGKNVNWSLLSTYTKNCLGDFLKYFLFWLTVFDQFFHNKCSQMIALGQETSTPPRPSIAIIAIIDIDFATSINCHHWLGSLEVHFSTCKDCRRELLVKSLMMSISNASNQEFFLFKTFALLKMQKLSARTFGQIFINEHFKVIKKSKFSLNSFALLKLQKLLSRTFVQIVAQFKFLKMGQWRFVLKPFALHNLKSLIKNFCSNC